MSRYLGLTGTFTLPVTRDITVAHYHPEMPEVLGTPFLVYAMEVAASNALRAHLPAGFVSVGVKVDATHLAPTPVGLTLTTKATVTAADDHTVHFTIEAHDGIEKVGECAHVRAVVELKRFEKRLKAKRREL